MIVRKEFRLFAKLRRYFKNASEIESNILTLAFGSIAARVVSLLAIPVLTRLYSPDNFGLLALFISCVALIVPFTTLRYHVAIPLPRYDVTAVCILVLSLSITLVVTALVALIILVFEYDLFKILSIEPLAPYRWLIVIGVASAGFYDIFASWSLRKKWMGRIARTQVIRSFSSVGVKISLGALGYAPIGLVLGQILQQAGGLISLTTQFAHDVAGKPRRFGFKRLVVVALRYRGFPALRLPSQILLVAATQLPLLLAAGMFGTTTAGQFALAFSALAIPVTFISQTVGSAYYAEIASLGPTRRTEIRLLTFSIMKKLAFIGGAPVVFLAFFAPWFFSVAFGEVWREAGHFAQILVVYLYVQIVTSPAIHILTVLEKHYQFFNINLVRFLLVIISFLVANLLNMNSLWTITAYAVAMVIHYSITSIKVIRVLGH